MRTRAPIVITRKAGQGIIIDSAEVTVLEVRGQFVKLGVRVSRGTAVYRSEKQAPTVVVNDAVEAPAIPEFLRNKSPANVDEPST